MEITVENLLAGSRRIDEMKSDIETFMSIIKGALLEMNHAPTGNEVTRVSQHWDMTHQSCEYNWNICYSSEFGGKVTDIQLHATRFSGSKEAVYIHGNGCALGRVEKVHEMLSLLLEVCLCDELLQILIPPRFAPYLSAIK